jgi:hypothetical protein
MLGMIAQKPTQLQRKNQIAGVFTICMVMFGNGQALGIVIVVQRVVSIKSFVGAVTATLRQLLAHLTVVTTPVFSVTLTMDFV